MKQFSILVVISFQITFCFAQVVNVSNATQLKSALSAAKPGQIITLADGIYSINGTLTIPAGVNGTSSSPIKLTGSAKAILTSNSLSSGYSLWLKGNSYWILEGFTVYKSQKGIVLDQSYHDIITNITVKNIGDEGIHLRTYSCYDTVQNCFVDSTGLYSPGYGEGIYLGSANSNWSTYTNGNPDTCNYNMVRGNSFGDHVAAENIDIKEGTTGGIITNNMFNGVGLSNVNGADSWIDAKGNYYTISCNTGNNSINDGFQTHIAYAGWGNYNTFSNNTLNVNGPGYGINVETSSSYGTATKNIVCTSNSETNAKLGLTNVTTQKCTGTCCSSATLPTVTASGGTVCAGSSITLSAGGASGYTWSNGLGTGTSKTVNPTTTATYTVTGTDANNCSNTSRAIVNVNPLPVTPVIIQSNDTLISNAPAGNQWYMTSGSILNETDSFYIPKVTDNYYVITTINGCSSVKSNVIYVVITGVAEKKINENINIYPNPASDKFFIEIDNQKESYNLEILNAIGQVILNKKLINSVEQIDLSGHPAGVYFLKLQSSNNSIGKKIIKQN